MRKKREMGRGFYSVLKGETQVSSLRAVYSSPSDRVADRCPRVPEKNRTRLVGASSSKSSSTPVRSRRWMACTDMSVILFRGSSDCAWSALWLQFPILTICWQFH